jgi:Protein of unknown function (DUF3570)
VKDRRAASASRAGAVGANSRRLRLAALALAALGGSVGLIRAQNDISIQFHAFGDTRGVTVLTPDVDLNRDLTDRTSLRVKFGVDAITSASDSCVRCHPGGKHDRRISISSAITQNVAGTKLSIGGELGNEKFYESTALIAGGSRDFNRANTTVAGGFSYAVNRPMRHPSDTVERQTAKNGYAAVTQTLSPTTVVQAGYEYAQIDGFQTNPYLRVNVNGSLILGNNPDARTRRTIMARLRQALPHDTFLEADYRRYHDSWAIDSNALSLGVSHRFSAPVLASVGYRFYDQSGVFFYQPVYTGSPQFYTSDFRLIPFDSGLYSARLEVSPHGGILRLGDGSALTLEYERYRADTGFQAAIFSAGLRIPF